MALVELRLYGTLNDFLPAGARGRRISRSVVGSPAVKDVIESVGVPHVEVGVIVADGEPVTFAHRVRDGERIRVYPFATDGQRVDASRLGQASVLGPPPLPPDRIRFVVDGHLGRLAAYLRMLGFDTAYSNDDADQTLAALAAAEDRILLSRDRGLLKRSIVGRGYFPRSDRPHEQLREVVRRFGLATASRPFSRCLRCNSLLERIELSTARSLVPLRVAGEQARFHRCEACGSVYWRGSHHARMVRLIQQLMPEWQPDAAMD